MHSGSFCKNFAHFSGNFWELKKVKRSNNGPKSSQNGQKKAKKGIRKVQKYHKNDKIGPKFVQ